MRRLLTLLPLVGLLAAIQVPAAGATSNQDAIFQDDAALHANMAGTLQQLRSLGVTRIRTGVAWANIAPGHALRGSAASNPAKYPAANWAYDDALVRTAAAYHIGVYMVLTGGVPRWAEGKGQPHGPAGLWKPNAAAFGAFVKAVGTRYSGHYHGLPRVSFWSIWNEPNYGQDLAPQSSHGGLVQTGAAMYRSLLGHAWGALRASGHGHDTILFGETAPHGYVSGGNFGGVAPLRWIRALYCLDSGNHPLRGWVAAANGCPTTAAGSRRFRAQNPALFSATGFAAHPYAQGTPPNRSLRVRGYDSANFADLARMPQLARLLDTANRTYGSGKRFPIYSTEYGFQTNPPERPGNGFFPVSEDVAATYMNWAEYISYKSSRIRSYDQYLLVDPPLGNFASGLEFSSGRHKAGYAAYRMPLYLPQTSARHSSSFEVWGAVRPARATVYGPGQQARIEFQGAGGGSWNTIKTFTVPGTGYFDFRVGIGQSGNIRIAWNDPVGGTDYSRTVAVRIG